MSFRDKVKPGVSRRADFPLVPRKAALLIIDIQKYLATPSSLEEDSKRYFVEEALPRTLTNINKVAQTFRECRDDPDAPAGSQTGCEVIFTFLQACTKDGRDISLDYKLSGSLLAEIPRVDCDPNELFHEQCKPEKSGKGDILLPKTSCSVFQSTNLDYLLRNLGIEQLVVVGQLTDQCVESAVRDAADLGYLVTVCDDACAAHSLQAHRKGIQGMKGFCRILETAQVMHEIVEGSAHELLDHSTGNKPATRQPGEQLAQVTDEVVLQYLREKGMENAADQLHQLFDERKNKT